MPHDNERNDATLVSVEREHRQCCANAWREDARARTFDFCERNDGGGASDSSDFGCVLAPTSKHSDDDDEQRAPVWYCRARGLVVNTSAISIGASDLTIPTAAQKGLWRGRALLVGCPLRRSLLDTPKRFGMLMRTVLPAALGELPHAAHAALINGEGGAAAVGDADDGGAGGGAGGGADGGAGGGAGGDEDDDRTVVFIARYSVKNFFLAHFDLLQVAAILLHERGADFALGTQLVFMPPDKANHGWWGPQASLWSSLSDAPALSYIDWARAATRRAKSRRSRLGGAGDGDLGLLPVRRAILALSGHHSVYGRGLIGRALERRCDRCGTAAHGEPRLARVSPFYRLVLSTALERAGLLYLAESSARHAVGIWISRGKGLGHGYGSKVVYLIAIRIEARSHLLIPHDQPRVVSRRISSYLVVSQSHRVGGA